MKLSSIMWGAAAAYIATQNSDSLPQAVGLDIDSMISQYLPAIMGVLVAIANESDSIPAWIKKLISEYGKSKDADIDFGNKSLSVYRKMLEMLEELKKEPQANAGQIANMRLALMAQHEKVVGYGPNED